MMFERRGSTKPVLNLLEKQGNKSERRYNFVIFISSLAVREKDKLLSQYELKICKLLEDEVKDL